MIVIRCKREHVSMFQAQWNSRASVIPLISVCIVSQRGNQLINPVFWDSGITENLSIPKCLLWVSGSFFKSAFIKPNNCITRSSWRKSSCPLSKNWCDFHRSYIISFSRSLFRCNHSNYRVDRRNSYNFTISSMISSRDCQLQVLAIQ